MKRLSFLALTALVALASCKRTDDSTDRPTQPTTPTTGFSRAFILDTTLAHPYDTIGRLSMVYDMQGRPLIYTRAEFRPNGDSLSLQRIQYTYNGAETRASRIDEYNRTNISTSLNVWTAQRIYTWANDKLVRDSTAQYSVTLSDTAYYTNTYSRINAGTTLLQGITRTRYGNTTNTGTYFQTFQGANVTSQVDTTYWVYNPSASMRRRTEYTNSFASVLNPMYVVSYPVYQDLKNDGGSFDDWFDSPKNVLLQRKWYSNLVPGTVPAVPQNTWTYTYTLDGQGRVDKIREQNTSSSTTPAVTRRTFVFQY